jgi:2-amino-4-hydroxy-6-hydroxymethyldihydropteridine diphosphokinase
MPLIYLSLGSNLGNRELHLQEAIFQIKLLGHITAQSSLYSSEPWGSGQQNSQPYLNQVLEMISPLQNLALLDKLQAIEQMLGRKTKGDNAPRSIDIDVLYEDSSIIALPQYIVPHPRLALRRFVLVPLCQIAPQFVHPIFARSNAQLLLDCPDMLSVQSI